MAKGNKRVLPKNAMDGIATMVATAAYEKIAHDAPIVDGLKSGAITGGVVWITDEFLNPVIKYVEQGMAKIPVVNKFTIVAADVPRAVVAAFLDVILSRYVTKHNIHDFEGGLMDLLMAAAYKFLIIIASEEAVRAIF